MGTALHHDIDVGIVGAGAAGIGAARTLAKSGLSVLLLEARNRLGGRAWTAQHGGYPLDIGCGWLHSADKNAWVGIAEELGLAIDRTLPPWNRQTCEHGLTNAEQAEFRRAFSALDRRIEQATMPPDRPAADFLEQDSRWNTLLDAVSTYYNGAPLAHVSALDYRNFEDTEVDWRPALGYGALVATAGADLPVMLGCAIKVIDHSGARIRLISDRGEISAAQVIVAVPASIFAAEHVAFRPALPEKIESARKLPLGVVNKVFLACDESEMFPKEGHLFGNAARVETGSYHLRPFGRPIIEAFFAGTLAEGLEKSNATAHYAIEELSALIGGDMRKHLKPLAASAWGIDPYALGSYSHAEVGHTAARTALAAPVDERIFFAGEACSVTRYSTAHGAFDTGVAAAQALVAARRTKGR